jgi:hypothetical protein
MANKAKKTRRLGQKQCPKCEKWIKGTRSKNCPYCGYEFQAKPAEAPSAQPAAAASATATTEKPVRTGDVITVQQIRAVGEMVKSVGGFRRFREMLDVIREVGGLKKLRDILEAMAVTEQGETKV